MHPPKPTNFQYKQLNPLLPIILPIFIYVQRNNFKLPKLSNKSFLHQKLHTKLHFHQHNKPSRKHFHALSKLNSNFRLLIIPKYFNKLLSSKLVQLLKHNHKRIFKPHNPLLQQIFQKSRWNRCSMLNC